MTTYKQARGTSKPGTNDGSWKTMERDDALLDGGLEEVTAHVEDLTDSWLAAHDPEFAAELERENHARKLLEYADDSAAYLDHIKGYSRRSGGYMDSDDVASESVLHMLERQANGHVVSNEKSYLHTVAGGLARRATSNWTHISNAKALTMYTNAVGKAEGALGRTLTPTEKDAIANGIVENWDTSDKRARPDKNFRMYAGQTQVSLDSYETTEQADAAVANGTLRNAAAESSQNEVEAGSYIDRALDAVEGHGGDMRDAKFLIWNALSENSADAHLLMVKSGLSQNRVTAIHKVMNADIAERIAPQVDKRVAAAVAKAQGASAKALTRSQVEKISAEARSEAQRELTPAANRASAAAAVATWNSGKTNEITEAFFSPWGTDPAARDAVCDQMSKYPDVSYDLWESALKLSNNRFAGR
jgi:hypothetical protein